MAAPQQPTTPLSITPPPASLYVGDLHPHVDDLQLSNAFSEYKSLSSVHVCRESFTGRSLCYGYLNFLSPQDAIHAIDSKNNTPLYGKIIRVSWSHKDPHVRKSGVGNVFVKNLNGSIDNAQLQELFQTYGTILSCKVETLEDGKSKEYGFVQFDSDECANAAIEKLNGTIVGGKEIYVGKFMRKSDRVLPGPDAKYTNLYIKNLEQDLIEDVLEQQFAKFGKIVSFVIARDDLGVSRGFGFVNYENSDDARKAVEYMNGLTLGSKVLYVARAQKRAEREQILRRQFEDMRKEKILKYQGSNLYVKNIDDNVTENQLHEHFSQCGTITSVKLMCDKKGLSKGFGFVCFSTPEEANKAVNTLHGFMFHGKPLYVGIAQRKEERQAHLQTYYANPMGGVVGPSSFLPGSYQPLFYTTPSGILSQVPPRHGMMYQQPMGHMRPGWSGNGFAPPTRPFIPNTSRPYRQNRGRMSGLNLPYVPQLQQPNQTSNQQRVGEVKHVANGVRSVVSNSVASVIDGQMLNTSMLSDASPEIQKQILGERLLPLVREHKPDLATNITGMLLEMDNSELLILLESPEILAAKVEKAVQVLNLSKTKESLQSNILSNGVAVN